MEEISEKITSIKREDLTNLVNILVNRIGAEIEAEDIDSLLTEINIRKEYHHVLSRCFFEHGYKSIPFRMHESKWGSVVKYNYDKKYNILKMSSYKTLLSLLITERALLAKKGLLKHLTIAIVGLSGSGKTTYSISSLIGALKLLGYSEEDILKILPLTTFFEAKNFVDYVVKSLDERIWSPAIILDDVGSQISKYWMWLGEKYWIHLFSIIDHVKDWCGTLIMTATSLNAIPSRLREKVDLVIEATEATYSGHILNIFTWYKNPGRSSKKNPVYIDVFPPTAIMPKELWTAMMEERRNIGLKRLYKLQEILSKVSELKEEKEREHGEESTNR